MLICESCVDVELRGFVLRKLPRFQTLTCSLPADLKSDSIPRTKSAGTLGDHGGSAGVLVLRFLAKTTVLIASVNILSDYANSIPRLVLEYVYGRHAIRMTAFGLHIEDMYYAATWLARSWMCASGIYCQHNCSALMTDCTIAMQLLHYTPFWALPWMDQLLW